MHLFVIGLSYKSAPLDLRENLSLTPRELNEFLAATGPNGPSDPLQECVVISTCNRLEVYMGVHSLHDAEAEIVRLLSQIRRIPAEAFQRYLYSFQDAQTVHHLMQVAAGLDSMVLGEPQILGQLVTAYHTALAGRTAQACLSRLFEMAIHAGKRARTETAIGHNPASVSSVAVQLAKQHLGDLAQQTVMVLGAGEMGSLTVQALIKQGVRKMHVVSRSQERAQTLAQTWQNDGLMRTGEILALTLAHLPQGLADVDVIITSTGATQPVLDQSMVAEAMAVRPERPLFIVDIGLPRDVEAAVGQLPSVHLYNLDDLEAQIAHNLKEREREIPQVRAIIAEETNAFWGWYQARSVVPTITHFRGQFEDIKEQELARTLNRLQHLDQRDQEAVAELAHRLLNKFLHSPTVHLKAEAAQGNGVFSTHALQKLFDLETN